MTPLVLEFELFSRHIRRRYVSSKTMSKCYYFTPKVLEL